MKLFFSANLNLLCNPGFERIQKQCTLVLLLIVCSIHLHATHTWTGAVNNDWSNAGNWSPASLPNSFDFVSIPNVANDPEIKSGFSVAISGMEMAVDASLIIKANGTLAINGSIGTALINKGVLDNFGNILIGKLSAIGGTGVQNNGLILNRQGALISVDHCTGTALGSISGDVQNFGKIIIGSVYDIAGFGIQVYFGELRNFPNAEIFIDQCSSSGLWMSTGSSFANFGKLVIGSNYNCGYTGIDNNGEINNNTSGEIEINRIQDQAIRNNSSEPFNNFGKINIGGIADAGDFGINNSSVFNNLGGEIKLDRVRKGLGNDYFGTFNNGAKLTIGSTTGLGDYGITNGGFFINMLGALITIDRVIGYGIETHGQTVGSFTNGGKIIIGAAAPVMDIGIYNDALFHNLPGSEISIDHITLSAIHNISPLDRPFKNEGKIQIGQSASVGHNGIKNKGGFTNEASGNISIDRATDNGLLNSSSFAYFENKGKLTIGFFASTGLNGIQNDVGYFGNSAGAELSIDRSTQCGILNVAANVINEGKMSIRGAMNSYSFKNTGSLTNMPCAFISLQDAVYNDGQWYSLGMISVNTLSPHTNVTGLGKSFTNDGILEYPQGNPIPNVVNHNLISVPVSANCNSITPALLLGNELHATVASNWYSNPTLTNFAGTYNQSTNTFIASAVASTLYFMVHDDAANCDIRVSVNATYQLDLTPPTVICKNPTAFLNAQGVASITAAQVFQSGTDNCGVVAPASVAPNAFDCGKLGANTVTLTANDGNGNNGTCIATVTVVDNLAPVLVCKPFTANLSAAGTVTITPANVFQSATDNCGVVNMQSVSPNTFSCANLGNQLVTLTGNDGHGNTGTCQATVTVADKIAPTMLCRPVTIALNASGQASLTVAQVNNGSYDNCGIIATGIDKTSFDCSNVGVNNVTLGGADQSSNKGQCVAQVTVTDPIKPVALCKDATANLGADGTLNLAGSVINNGSSDNCTFTLSTSPGSFNCANVGLNTVTLKVTDNGGNLSTCTAKVTIKDVTAPLALCKNTSIYLNDAGQATLSAAQVNNGSSDACGIATINLSKTAFNCSDIPGSAQTVILTFKDVNNNTSTCNAQVTTKDITAPTAVCENTSVQLGSNGMATVYSANLSADSYDNCSVYAYSPVAKVYTSANLGNNNLNITVKDWSNNGASCVSVVQVLPYNHLKGAGGDRDAMLEAENPAFNLYPNPSSGAGTLRFEFARAQDFMVILYDLSGRILWSEQGTGNEGANTLSMDASHLPSGIYFLDFQAENLKKQIRWGIQN